MEEMDEPAQDPSETNVFVFFKTYRIPILLGAVSLLCIIVSLTLLVKTSQSITPIQFSHTGEAGSALGSESGSLTSIVVDVEGAVSKPGPVTLSQGARVEDAIAAAGGLNRDADENYVSKNINRATKVTDGMKVYVPTKDETSHNSDCTTSQGDVAQSCGIVTTSTGQSQNATLISVNSASKDALDSLPGVGPVTAQKIIDNRPYQTLDDLVTKKAIGPSLYQKLKNMLSL